MRDKFRELISCVRPVGPIGEKNIVGTCIAFFLIIALKPQWLFTLPHDIILLSIFLEHSPLIHRVQPCAQSKDDCGSISVGIIG